MAKRINVILPEATALQQRLKHAALRDRDLDFEIAKDWFTVDQKQWQKLDTRERQQGKAGLRGGKSTSRRSSPP